MSNKNIEFSPELKPLLTVLAEKANAQTVILYKYIEIDDLEGTELLDLLCNSQMFKNNENNFYNNVLNKEWSAKIKNLIETYNNGSLVIEKESELHNRTGKSDLNLLKDEIRVLRFNEYYEKNEDNRKKKYNFDYTKRPQKYLVFSDNILEECYKKDRDKDKIKIEDKDKYQIKEEGITAYICRAQENALIKLTDQEIKDNSSEKPIIYKNEILAHEILKKNDAHCNYSNKGNDFKIYGHNAAWKLLKNEKAEVIGCLRFEYDPEEKKELKSLPEFGKEEINLIVQIIIETLKKRGKYSYDDLYSCLNPILYNIMEIGLELNKIGLDLNKKKEEYQENDNRLRVINKLVEDEKAIISIQLKVINKLIEDEKAIKSIHEKIEHLFYVFKRNTYYGDLIYDRINKFIEALLKELGLNEKIFLELWESLRKQEDLMLYDLENYRDHFIHQFHVFILGYIFIHKYGLNELCELIQFNYKNQKKSSVNINDEFTKAKLCELIKFNNKNQKKYCVNIDGEFTKTDVLRIWVLTSLFHDCGYSFEKLSKGHDTFSKNIIKEKLDSNFSWDKLILESEGISDGLLNITKYFIDCLKEEKNFSNTDLFKTLLKSSIINNDHGVISSIILKQQYKDCNMVNEIPLIDSIINISALSIALHNKSVFLNLSKEHNQSICFYCNPFACILAYSDTAQEWGRKKGDKQNKQISSPKLLEISFEKDKSFKVSLEYKPNSKGKTPTKEFVNTNLFEAKNSFISDCKMKFLIKYKVEEKDNIINFQNCSLN